MTNCSLLGVIGVKFGEYLKNKRILKGISQTKSAKMYGISLSYLSSIERGLRPAPTNDVIESIANTLELNAKERNKLYDLAAESKKPPALADDLIEYVHNNPIIRDTLRYSMECSMTENDWENVLGFIKKNYFY